MTRVRLADTTNKMVLYNFTTECQGACYLEDGMFFIDNEEARTRETALHRTSLVVSFEIKEKLLIVQTLNSTYTYEILQGTPEAFEKMFEQLDTDMISKIQGEREQVGDVYWGESAEGWIIPVRMPRPMKWDEAVAYVQKNSHAIETPDGIRFIARLLGLAQKKKGN